MGKINDGVGDGEMWCCPPKWREKVGMIWAGIFCGRFGV